MYEMQQDQGELLLRHVVFFPYNHKTFFSAHFVLKTLNLVHLHMVVYWFLFIALIGMSLLRKH